MNDPEIIWLIYKQQERELLQRVELHRWLAEARVSGRISPPWWKHLAAWLKAQARGLRVENRAGKAPQVCDVECASPCSCG